MMENTPLIRLQAITFGYDGKPLLFNKLNLSVFEGQRIGLIGPNGCGKTTLFHIIMGFLKPREGKIEIAGIQMETERDLQKARTMIGFLFQNSDDQIFCPTVREEVAFGPLNQRRPKSEVERLVTEALNLVGLDGYEDRAPYLLSEGEKKRLAIASIIVMEPKILLLDEPTNGLDDFGVMVLNEFLRKKDFTYIIISQDKKFLKETTQVVYTIEDGRLKEFNL